ncbi:MAG: polyphosphate kinase 2 family protein [Verrucomicrobiota bacterium]|nr:polyphosphate kinase 2 family protein [Verrucomicrobiota bacterium]
MKHSHRFDHSKFLVPSDKKIKLSDYDPDYTADFKDKEEALKALAEDKEALAEAQEMIYANARGAGLIIFQAMDAAGKDGAIKHVMSGVNPQGCNVSSFKTPSSEDVSHNFLWRYAKHAPEKGKLGIFNRSYYEEVLVTRVHTNFLDAQKLPVKKYDKDFWKSRYDDINAFEKHLTNTGTVIIKFFLNLSKTEQKGRFLDRLNKEEKHWKFSAADLRERGFWDQYMQAYEEMLSATSTEWAPWYVIPANKKWFTRSAVADIVITHIERQKLEFPKVSKEQLEQINEARKQLENE